MITASPTFFNIEEYAALSLRYKRGTETALLKGLMRIILEKGWEDSKFIEQRTEGFEELKAILDRYEPDRVSRLTHVAAEQLYEAAEIMAMHRPTAAIWASELTRGPAGTNNVLDLANLQMLMGNLGVPGGGVAPLRGQNNAQGAADMGGHPAFYPGYQPVTDEHARQEFESAWGVELSPMRGTLRSSNACGCRSGFPEGIVHPR